jgi:hypothetical protein
MAVQSQSQYDYQCLTTDTKPYSTESETDQNPPRGVNKPTDGTAESAQKYVRAESGLLRLGHALLKRPIVCWIMAEIECRPMAVKVHR